MESINRCTSPLCASFPNLQRQMNENSFLVCQRGRGGSINRASVNFRCRIPPNGTTSNAASLQKFNGHGKHKKASDELRICHAFRFCRWCDLANSQGQPVLSIFAGSPTTGTGNTPSLNCHCLVRERDFNREQRMQYAVRSMQALQQCRMWSFDDEL